jgi:hypothetical protein
MSEVLYLRLPEERKQALAARAHERGLSLNASACELIARGLQADEVSGRVRSLTHGVSCVNGVTHVLVLRLVTGKRGARLGVRKLRQ